jgi:hypothetical protein
VLVGKPLGRKLYVRLVRELARRVIHGRAGGGSQGSSLVAGDLGSGDPLDQRECGGDDPEGGDDPGENDGE